MVDLQTSYARSLESLNIERGIQGSRARPMKMQKMYAKFNADTTLPEPEAGETAVQYKARIEDKATQILAVSHRRAGEDYRKVMRTAGRGWNLYVERQKEELKAETSRATRERINATAPRPMPAKLMILLLPPQADKPGIWGAAGASGAGTMMSHWQA
jgi:hypothetical protein